MSGIGTILFVLLISLPSQNPSILLYLLLAEGYLPTLIHAKFSGYMTGNSISGVSPPQYKM